MAPKKGATVAPPQRETGGPVVDAPAVIHNPYAVAAKSKPVAEKPAEAPGFGDSTSFDPDVDGPKDEADGDKPMAAVMPEEVDEEDEDVVDESALLGRGAEKAGIDPENFWRLQRFVRPTVEVWAETGFELAAASVRRKGKGKGKGKGASAAAEEEAKKAAEEEEAKKVAEEEANKEVEVKVGPDAGAVEDVLDQVGGGAEGRKARAESKVESKADVVMEAFGFDIEPCWALACLAVGDVKTKEDGAAANGHAGNAVAAVDDGAEAGVELPPHLRRSASAPKADADDGAPSPKRARTGDTDAVTAATEAGGAEAPVAAEEAAPVVDAIPAIPLNKLSAGKLKTVAKFFHVDVSHCLEKSEILSALEKENIGPDNAKVALEWDVPAPATTAAAPAAAAPAAAPAEVAAAEALFAALAAPEAKAKAAGGRRAKAWRPAFGASVYVKSADPTPEEIAAASQQCGASAKAGMGIPVRPPGSAPDLGDRVCYEFKRGHCPKGSACKWGHC